ncbi:carboxyl-terminal protease [Chthoniobacter flavus Ellin428]|uniref:Carboxyl-terminal protease n=1 Tax=Chthoniobacter flavus Ellin428 TaxID=497964 RepID=B4D6P1_9BACT|nr:carboxy terminal-processing peptidase [Chthoniobacter flavus]EDY17842.1 carboxyl-terminal protease [Chthoniobacter flavus Ellin428]TCO88454.1 carboxyl-terminal processing protease [Chthoniobacter flavus]
MKHLFAFCAPLAFSIALAATPLQADTPDPGQIEISVGRLLEQGHYSRMKLDEKVSQRFLKYYLEGLDYNRLYFTQKDVDLLTAKYGNSLNNDVLLGNPDPAFTIFNIFKKKVEDRIAKIKDLLNQKYDFTSNRSVEVNRQKAPWPKDEAEADLLWRDRIEGELLQETLNKHATDTPVKVLTRRYDQVLRNLHEQTKEDIVKGFLTTLAQTYDPHSEYMSKSELDNFQINMRLSLVGIGAVLHSEDGYAKIAELVPGGPASKDGHLKVGDKVAGVAQGDKDFVDCVDMKLDKVVEMIRGKKDTIVRLQVIPASATDPSVRKVIEIKRDEIKLKEQEAKAEIIERPGPDGNPIRLGWVILPSFYADMEHSGAAGAKSTTKDVLALINRLKQEHIQGLVMDLRKNGGGSLEEAVNLTGLFIKRGPVVQAKDSNGNIHVSKDRDPSVAWDGPMIVCTNRLSASASEIFAAALQDYNRAVIVGDKSTFGKGTVQTMLEIGRIMPFLGSGNNEAGALKLTIQKFYRIAGGSTQHKGVESDVHLPSLFDRPEIGESALKGPLPYDTVPPAEYDKWERPLFKNDLRQRSAARVAADAEFHYINEDLAEVEKHIAENRVSLNIQVRRTEIDEDKAKRDKRAAAREKVKQPDAKTYVITLDNVNKPDLQLVTYDTKDKKVADGAAPATTNEDDNAADDEDGTNKSERFDPIKSETLNILNDLIDLSRNPKTATASTAK